MVAYLLFLKVKKNFAVKVGSLGKIEFGKGFYVYVGSAKNSRKRILRHFKRNKKLHWHIDYLTSNENCSPLFAYVIEKDVESQLANYLSKYYFSIKDFGASDTKDGSHLFRIA